MIFCVAGSIPPGVPQILINREPLPHFNFDVELLGDSDVIINHICHMYVLFLYKHTKWIAMIMKRKLAW
jgi:hypothetical protein